MPGSVHFLFVDRQHNLTCNSSIHFAIISGVFVYISVRDEGYDTLDFAVLFVCALWFVLALVHVLLLFLGQRVYSKTGQLAAIRSGFQPAPEDTFAKNSV